MKRFKKILVVATDQTEAAAVVKRAGRLAASNGAHVTLFDVMPPLPRDTKKLFKLVEPEALESMLREKRLQALEELAAPLREKGIEVNTALGVGTPFVEIIREVLRNGHDLVIKGAIADEDSRPLFGSTDMHLMRECPCAVWMVKPTKSRKVASVLAAVDPDPADLDKNQLNQSIMELATSLAQLEKSELHVVHAWVLYSEELLHALVGKVDRLARETRKTHRKWLNALLDRFEISHDRSRIHLLKGKAKDVIPRLARKKRIEVIVIGTAARTGLPHFLIGNTAEDVLSQVDCSVLTVKQEKFVCPIALED